jgi:DNA-directed RNA polymerase specialized sigma24 family protein
VAANINWTLLTPQAKKTLRLAALISSGLSPAEAGAVLGMSKEAVKTAMAALREEIRAQQKSERRSR